RGQVRPAERLQRVRPRSGLLRRRSRPLHRSDRRHGPARGRTLSAHAAARGAERRPARARRARAGGIGRGGGRMKIAPAGAIRKGDRARLPEPEPGAAYVFPVIEKSALANGLRVWTIAHPAVPVVTAILLMRRGAASDPLGKEGLAALTIDMLDEGSGSQSAIEMHEALARIGAQFDSDIGSDAAALTVTTLKRFTGRALALMADLAARPTLAEADVVRVRQLRLHRLMQMRDMPGAVADRAVVRLLYGGHSVGHTPVGSERPPAALSADGGGAVHAGELTPGVSTLIVAGDCDHADVLRVAAEQFGSWAARPPADARADGAVARPARLNVVPRPGAPQSELRIGHVAAPRDTPDYHALVAANMVLGGQFVSRINLNLRANKGFTYGARTTFDCRRMPGPFLLQASVHTASTSR